MDDSACKTSLNWLPLFCQPDAVHKVASVCPKTLHVSLRVQCSMLKPWRVYRMQGIVKEIVVSWLQMFAVCVFDHVQWAGASGLDPADVALVIEVGMSFHRRQGSML